MQLSYAQNLEDYHLDLMFAGQQDGTYVDVGAGHPVADNVSFWFYLKGWRGLVVEPQQRWADLYAGVRPRDYVVACLAGRAEGRAQFHIVEKLHGFSSMRQEHAAAAGVYGVGYATTELPVRTLAGLCAEAGLARVDFLKVDVEGAEADVLAGMDFARYRPRVLVVEAVAPQSMAQSFEAWEAPLLNHGYRFAFFDRLNRFYVTEEDRDLARHLPQEPTPWDRVQHLWDCGRAPDRPDHPDHALARVLHEGFLASLPLLDTATLARVITRGLGPGASSWSAVAKMLIGTAELPKRTATAADLEMLLRSDALRAALGRIACAWDGGQIMDDAAAGGNEEGAGSAG
jgi:FkbM family methyltransferase